jgi:hypothetical protein
MQKYKLKRAEASKIAQEQNKQVVLGWPMFASLRNSPQLMFPIGKSRVIKNNDLNELRSWVCIANPDGSFIE